MRSLIIRRLAFVGLLIVAYLGSLQWETQRADAVIEQLLAGSLEQSDYDIQWINPGVSVDKPTLRLRGSQVIGSEAEVFYGRLYLLQLSGGEKVVAAIYPGLFWPTAITIRRTD